MISFRRSSVFGCVLLGLISTALYADPLPSAVTLQYFTPRGVVYSGSPVGMGGQVANNGSFTQVPNSGTVGYTASSAGGSDPSTFVHLGVSGAFGTGVLDQFDLRSSMTYYFEVAGPANQSAVINLAGSGAASVTPQGVSTLGAESMIGLSLQSSPSDYLVEGVGCAGDTSHLTNQTCAHTVNPTDSFNLNANVNVDTDTVYLVTLWSESYFGTTGSYPLLDAFAGADPTVTLISTDPALSLEFSPELTPSAVPEPATSSLMMIGAGGLVWLSLRRGRLSAHSRLNA